MSWAEIIASIFSLVGSFFLWQQLKAKERLKGILEQDMMDKEMEKSDARRVLRQKEQAALFSKIRDDNFSDADASELLSRPIKAKPKIL